RVNLVPVALADEQRRARERRELAGMVAVKVADADELDLVGRDVELLQAIHDADFRRVGIRAGSKAGVPHHVLGPMLDQVAAIRERQLEILVRKRVAEALVDVGRLGGSAAVDARKRKLGWRWRLGKRR